MLYTLVTLLCILSLCGFAQKNDSLVVYLKKKVNEYLILDKELNNYFEINREGVFIYQSANNKQKNKPEFFVPLTSIDSCARLIKNWEEFEKIYGSKSFKYFKPYLKDYTENLPVRGLKGKIIVIDPGHISNQFAEGKIEGKCLRFVADSAANEGVIEGRLTMATALVLKEKLEKHGAVVHLTRPNYGKSSFNQSFYDWLQSDSSGYAGRQLTDKELRTIFSKYNNSDLINRSKIINKIKPDLTIIIHFNVDEKNNKWERPSQKNFNMIFLPGALSKGDLNTKRDRMEFLRLLITEDFENSLIASSYTIKSLEEKTNVPSAKPLDADYLIQKSLPTPVTGVYCRNLVLTRLCHGTLVYGETLYQDNEKEYELLSVNDIEIGGQKVSRRVIDVAEAYFIGIKNYFESKQ